MNAAAPPQTANVKTPTKFGRALELLSAGNFDPTGGEDTTKPPESGRPTKFGALLNVIRPMLGGAAVGGFLGRSTPEGGFGAANNFFLQQRLRQMQASQFFLQQLKAQSEIQKNQAETQWAQRRPLITRSAPTIKGTDDAGNPIFMSQNPSTGEWEPVSGIKPEDQANYKEVPTDKGLVTYNTKNPRGGAIPLTLRGTPDGTAASGIEADINGLSGESSAAPSRAASRVPGNVPAGMFGTSTKAASKFDSGVPTGSPSQSPAAIASAGVPLRPPSFGQPKPVIRASRDAAGNERDMIVDNDPNSPTFGQTIKKTGITRAPVPDKTGNRTKVKGDLTAHVEELAGEALKRNGNDPDKAIAFINNLQTGDPETDKLLKQYLPDIRKSIRDRTKQGKKRLTLSPEDAKAAGLEPTNKGSVADEEEPDENNP